MFQSIRAPDRHARELVAAAQCSQMRAVFAQACSVAWPTSPQPSAGRHLLCLPFGFVLDWQTVSTCCCLGATWIVKACTPLRHVAPRGWVIEEKALPAFSSCFQSSGSQLWRRTPPPTKDHWKTRISTLWFITVDDYNYGGATKIILRLRSPQHEELD